MSIKQKNREVATAIKHFITKYDMASDTSIYFNGICWRFDSDGNMKVLKDIKASDYFEYANDKTVSVSTEGDFYNVLNMYDGYAMFDEFVEFMDAHGASFEMGHAWNFSVFYD